MTRPFARLARRRLGRQHLGRRHLARRCLAIGVASFAAVMVLAGPAVAGDQIPGQIGEVTTQGREMSLVVTAPGLPAGAHIDPTKVESTFLGSDAGSTVADLTASASLVGNSAIAPASTPRVMLAVDISGSMTGARVNSVVAALNAFFDAVPDYVQIGLTTFTDKQQLVTAPITDRATLRSAISKLKTGGKTDIYGAVRFAVNSLGSAGERRVILFSDGDVTTTSTSAQLLNELRAAQVPIDTVGFSANAPGESLLSAIASASGGQVVDSSDTQRLVDALRGVGQAYTGTTKVTIAVPPDQAGRRGMLTIQLPAGPYLVVVASTSLTLPGTVAETPASTTLAGVVYHYHGLSLPILLGIVLAATLLTLLLLMDPGSRKRKRRTRGIELYARAASGAPPVEAGAGLTPSAVARGAVDLADRAVSQGGGQDRLELALDRAGLPLRPGEWVVLQVVLSAGAAVLVAVLFNQVLIGPIVGALLGWLATRFFLAARIRRRVAAFDDQLPDVFQLLAGSLSAGFSLNQALEKAASEGQNPIAGELARALAESRIGVDIADCLDKVAERMQSTDLTWMVMAIRIQREVGGNLSEVLQTAVHTMRERAAVRRHVRGLSAEGRLSAYILMALPLGLGLFFLLVRTDYIRPLWTTFPGLVMLIGGTVLMIVGWFWMRATIKVEV